MLKFIKRLLGGLILLALLALALLSFHGWTLYREMEREQPLSDRVNEVRLKEDFTPYEELPQT